MIKQCYLLTNSSLFWITLCGQFPSLGTIVTYVHNNNTNSFCVWAQSRAAGLL